MLKLKQRYKIMNIDFIKKEIDKIVLKEDRLSSTLQAICDLLASEVSYYNWVGFYFKNGNKKELNLLQFTGEPTEHTIIPFGKGICGQVAESNQNFVVQDVTEQDNYISCGWKVKSEIVVPIFVNGNNIGQIDIDSHTANVFSKKDEDLLEYTCQKVSSLLEKEAI